MDLLGWMTFDNVDGEVFAADGFGPGEFLRVSGSGMDGLRFSADAWLMVSGA